MEDSSAIDQSSASGRSSSRHLRYPLRSGAKSKEEKPRNDDSSSAPRRGRPVSSVSKSIGVLDLSAKEKSAKPPRRLSVPSKSASKPIGSITPISETRTKRPRKPVKNDTPISNVSKSSDRKKFNMLCSASYWLSQIKLSESAAKHSISLGFFKLALVAGCEPLQRMKDELKSYAQKHNLAECGESVKELFENYNIIEDFEQLQVSETCSHVPEEGTRSSEEDLRSSSSFAEVEQVKLKSSDTDAAKSKQVKEPIKETTQKYDSGTKIRRSANKNASKVKSESDTGGRNTQKKPQKLKPELNKNKGKAKKPAQIPAKEEDLVDPLPVEKTLEENKENMDVPQVEEINSSEV